MLGNTPGIGGCEALVAAVLKSFQGGEVALPAVGTGDNEGSFKGGTLANCNSRSGNNDGRVDSKAYDR